MRHAERNNILYPLQHGFRSKRSCETQLLECIDDLTMNLENGKQTDLLILDFSKPLIKSVTAYYSISSITMESEIQQTKWIQTFWYNRTQVVAVDGETSDKVHVESGVPQGSVLGPSLFLFYINDMPQGLYSTVRLFADDTIVYLTVSSDSDCSKLQSDLDKLAKWENIWKMEFHPFQHILCNPDPKNNWPIKSHVGIRPGTDMSTWWKVVM
jgi:hypothetical protein